MGTRANLFANYGGQIVASALAFALAPMFVRTLGLEAWGLIGVLALLGAWFNLLDFGLTPALTREFARAGGDARAVDERTRALLGSVGRVYLAIAVLTVLGVGVAAGPIASGWLRLGTLAPADAARAIDWMGVVVALRLYENVPRAVLTGLQELPLLNALAIAFALVRWVGGLALVVYAGSDVVGFFAWQAFSAALSVAAFVAAARRRVRPAGGGLAALATVRAYAAGMAASTILGFALTQIDKLLLSRLLTMAEFGAYLLAATLADALALLASPLYAVMLPRFVRLFERGEQDALAKLYLQAAQWLAVVLVPCAAVLVLFGEAVVRAWTGDAPLGRTVAPLVALLALGRMLNATMQLPAALQAAAGWTTLAVRMNTVAVLLLVPLVVLLVPGRGALAYAWCWVALNAGYLVYGTWRMHRRLLPAARGPWLRVALLGPGAAAFGLLGAASLADVLPQGRAMLALALGALLAAALAASALASPGVRATVVRIARGGGA